MACMVGSMVGGALLIKYVMRVDLCKYFFSRGMLLGVVSDPEVDIHIRWTHYENWHL